MPAKSKKQEKFMQAVANNPAFAKKVGVPQSVGKEFSMKKKPTKKYPGGGTVSSAQVNKPAGSTPGANAGVRPNTAAQYTRMSDRFDDRLGRLNARMTGMEAGERKTRFQDRYNRMSDRFDDKLENFAEKRGYTPPAAKKGGTMKTKMKKKAVGGSLGGPLVNRQVPPKKYAAGGLAAGHKAADGIAKKGKTKGKEVAMKKGGYMKGGKC